MIKKIPVKIVDSEVYEGGNIPKTLIHLYGVAYYVHTYTNPNSEGNVYMVLKEWIPF